MIKQKQIKPGATPAPGGTPSVGAAPATPSSTTSTPSGGGQQLQGMSTTAGPISAAVGATGGGAAATGNFTDSLAPVKTPKFDTITSGQLGSPTSIANYVQGYQNKANDANAQRYGQALGVMGQAQGSSNQLYGNAQNAVSTIGQQELSRIDQNLQQSLGGVAQDAVSRGLNNTTIADTMQYMPQRQAEDARQGVNEQQAKLTSGLDTQQATSQQQYGNQISALIGSRNDSAPNINEYSNLMQASAAGGNGAATHRTGQVTNYPTTPTPSPTGGSGGGGGSGGSFGPAGSPSASGPTGQAWGMSGMSGGGGGAGGAGGSFGNGTGPITGALGQYPDGANVFMGNGGSASGSGGSSFPAVGDTFMNNAGNTSITRLADAPAGGSSSSSSGPISSAVNSGQTPLDQARAALNKLRQQSGGLVMDNDYKALERQYGLASGSLT